MLPGVTCSNFSVLEPWPEMPGLTLDASQLAAMQHALTNEVSLIQGPPGTGKTFVGLKIMHALLENTRQQGRRRTPILVMCVTNHALDQFLEGISTFCERIVRIGSRSKSEAMQEKMLKKVLYEIQPSRRTR